MVRPRPGKEANKSKFDTDQIYYKFRQCSNLTAQLKLDFIALKLFYYQHICWFNHLQLLPDVTALYLAAVSTYSGAASALAGLMGTSPLSLLLRYCPAQFPDRRLLRVILPVEKR